MLHKVKRAVKRIWQYKLSAFIYYNYMCKNVVRKKGCYLIPYKYSVISIHKNAKLVLDANLYLNNFRLKGSKEECYLVLQENAKLHIKGDVSLRNRSMVQVNSGGKAEFGYFTSNVGINIQCGNHIVIGEDCMIGRNVTIYDSTYHPTGTDIAHMKVNTSPVVIGNHVWIGSNAVIMQGSHLGDGCVIGTNATITGKLPSNTMVAAHSDQPQMTGILWARDMSRVDDAMLYNQVSVSHADFTKIDEKQVQCNEKKLYGILSSYSHSVDYAKETALVDQGIFDSLDLMSIVSLISEAFQIQIPFTEVNAHNFNSVYNMAVMIANLTKNHNRVEESKDVQESKETSQMELLDLDKKDAELSVVQRIFRNAKTQPAYIAVIAEDKQVTYGELAEKIYTIGLWLKQIGVAAGDRVVVQGVHRALCVELYYAIHLIGGILVPVEKKIPVARILTIAQEVQAKVIISLEKKESEKLWFQYDEVEKAAADVKKYIYEDLEFPNIDTSCEMIFTTGTTGKSKGVLITHRNISWYAYAVAKAIEMKKENRFFITTPLNHAGGIRRTHLSLANGCTVVYMDGLNDLGKYFEYIEKYKITSLYLPPVAIRILLTRAKKELGKYKNQIDFVYSSSSSLPLGDCETMRELLPYTRLYNAYEASETPGVSVYNYNTNSIKKDCIGQANDGAEYGILLENGSIVKTPFMEGQLCVKSKMNMKEYFQEPELTKQVMNGDWFISSDLGYIDSDGLAYYKGRKGDVINIGGYKIAPTEVEETALLSGLISECICIEDMDSHGANFLKLLVVKKPDTELDEIELKKYMAAQIEPYKIPRIIEETDGIEKTFNGKINRKAYRK